MSAFSCFDVSEFFQKVHIVSVCLILRSMRFGNHLTRVFTRDVSIAQHHNIRFWTVCHFLKLIVRQKQTNKKTPYSRRQRWKSQVKTAFQDLMHNFAQLKIFQQVNSNRTKLPCDTFWLLCGIYCHVWNDTWWTWRRKYTVSQTVWKHFCTVLH